MIDVRGVALLFFSAAFNGLAQDPYTIAPDNYKLEFENEWVRVSRVTFRPGEKLPVHDHPALPAIYIYTTDGGPIRFGHQEFAALERPAVRAGQIRFNRGSKETHTVEYLGDAPGEYVRIEMKGDIEKPRRDIRLAAGNVTPFENASVRISRADCDTCDPLPNPAVIVTMRDRHVHWVNGQTVAGPQIRVELKLPARVPPA